MSFTPETLATGFVTILALIFYFATSILVSKMRVKHGITAPATSGHPEFDRAFRVQMNTLEHLVVIIPLMWMGVAFFRPFPAIAPILGAVWVLGRILYLNGYMKAADKRGPGFGICAIAEVLLLLLTLGGIVMDAL